MTMCCNSFPDASGEHVMGVDPALDKIVKSREYKRYCKVYKVLNPLSKKDISFYLIWKSFGCKL